MWSKQNYKPIKIGILGHKSEFAHVGGIERSVHAQINSLSDCFELYSYCRCKDYDLDSRRTFVKAVLPMISFLRPLNALIGAIRLRFMGVKILHVHGLNSTLFLRVYEVLFRKVFVTYHSQDYKYPKWKRIAKLILKISEREIIKSDCICIVISERYKSILTRKGKDVQLIYNGIFDETLEVITTPIKSEYNEYKFVVVGRITPEKQQVELLKSLPQKEGCSWIFIGGIDSSRSYGNEFLELQKNRSDVKFLGTVRNETVLSILKDCYYVSTSSFEGLSLAVIEGIIYSKGVFLSQIPGNLELNLPDKNYFSNIDDLSSKIENPNRYMLTLEMKNRVVKQFSLQKYKEQLKRIYIDHGDQA